MNAQRMDASPRESRTVKCVPGADVTRRGMTLLEVALAAALVLGVFALAAPSFGGDRIGAEGEARAALSAALDAQWVVRERSGAFSTSAGLLDPLTPRVNHQTGPSTGPSTVSVATTQVTIGGELVDVVGVAVLDRSGSCWVGKVSVHPTGGTLYGVDSSPASCSGGYALTATPDPSQPGRGSSPSEPLEL